VQRVELFAGPSGEPIAKHNSVQVVGLVLQATSEQACANHLYRFAVLVEPTTRRMIRPRQLDIRAR